MTLQHWFAIVWTSCVYCLFAVGLSIQLGVMRVLNVAHVSLYALGAIAGWWLVSEVELPLGVGFVGATLIGAVVGAVMYLLVFRPVASRTPRPEAGEANLIAGIGLSLVITTLLLEATGGDDGSFPEGGLRGRVFAPVDGLRITGPQLTIILLTTVTVAGLMMVIRRTRAGRSMRAIAYDGEIAAAMGINVPRVSLLFFAVSTALASLAGVMLGFARNEVHYSMGHELLLVGVAAVVVGGFGSVLGTALGSLAVSTAQVVAAVYLPSRFAPAVPFVLIVLMILARPEGLFPIAKTESV